MSIDFEQETKRLLAEIKKSFPQDADEGWRNLFTAFVKQAEYFPDRGANNIPKRVHGGKLQGRPILEVLPSNKDTNKIDKSTNEFHNIEKVKTHASEQRKVKNPPKAYEELRPLFLLISRYVKKHNVQETDALGKAFKTLVWCRVLAWIIFLAKDNTELDLLMYHINAIEEVCDRIIPAMEQNTQISYLYNMEKKKEKKRKKIGKKNQAYGEYSSDVLKANEDRKKALIKVRRLINDGIFSKVIEACRYVCKGVYKSNGSLLKPESLAKAYRKQYGTNTNISQTN